MTGAEAPDGAERRRALDPGASFIVQAPAGSGKTELLIQRCLVLLGRVQRPEEIAAITFTRKAAAEMRQRVLDALAAARGAAPAEPHRRVTWEHARRALDQDRAQGWGLEDNPGRLRIQTIDALCASLTRQMPVVSAFGAQPESLDDATELYREAARATLALVDDEGPAGECMARLLAHVDNSTAEAESLITAMLERREHWLRHLAHGLDRAVLERSVAAECRAVVARINDMLPADLRLAPGAGAEECHALAGRLLTQKGEWKKRSTEAQSLADAADEDALRAALHALRKLPPARYGDSQWEALGAMMQLLPLAVAELKLVFAAHGQADFVEIAQRALAALGGPDSPTDLMLSLDYRIRHLLVDEFQDTSYTQYRLLETLTEGWEPGDGRTLFLVGDPMQSIYRFREAEVGLFLKARREGLGAVHLEPLTLSSNFRSHAGIVDWINAAFARVMPAREDVAAGAVPYSPSEAVRAGSADAVAVHAFFDDDAAGEAARVAALVADAQQREPGSIAVLVRSRSHLQAIVPALRQAGLRIRAIEIEPLGHRQAVQDLLALTRALLHPADRIAWLAVLRAPWCGLTLADLYALAGGPGVAPERRGAAPTAPMGDLFPETLGRLPAAPGAGRETRTVWQLAHDPERLARMSDDGRRRLERTLPALDPGDRLRGSLRERVEGAWLALAGPACIADDTDLEDADIYFDFLDRCEDAGEVGDLAALEKGVEKLFALPDLHAGADDAQILTIHKAKGLEFDTVIVPRLGAPPRNPDPSLLLWTERPAGGGRGLLLAPIREAGAGRDALYDYIVALEGEKESHEIGRLLYVAATRARKQLHLLGDVARDAPAAGSLLEKLWPVLAPAFGRAEAAPRLEAAAAGIGQDIDQNLRRLPAHWIRPGAPPAAAWKAPSPASLEQTAVEFSWAGEVARHVGSVVHRWLQRVAEEGLDAWDAARVAGLVPAYRAELAARGVDERSLDAAVERVGRALSSAIGDPRGRWLLGPQSGALNEYRLAALVDGERRHLVVDRVFVDAEGRRWIVDYKTSSHEGADREAFLDRERERYREQLERYAGALGGAAEGRLGLYFPLLSGWRDWSRTRS